METTTAIPNEQVTQHPRRGPGGLFILYKKELADHLRSKRFLIILALVAITGIASLYGALSGMEAALEEGGTGSIFLKLFTTSGNSIPSFVYFLGLLGPLVGLTLGFDAINGERTRGTLGRLLAQPIHRDAVINGKFLAGLTLIAIMVISLGVIVSGVGLIGLGVAPTGEDVGRLAVFLLYSIIYMAFWLGLSILFSVLLRHAATSALVIIALWLFFAIFMSLIANIAANAAYPVTDSATTEVLVQNYELNQGLSRVSPTYLYNEAASTVLDPSIRAIGLVTTEQVSGAITGLLPLSESLLLVWPHLTGLLALTMISFALSYIFFMRQEIRAN